MTTAQSLSPVPTGPDATRRRPLRRRAGNLRERRKNTIMPFVWYFGSATDAPSPRGTSMACDAGVSMEQRVCSRAILPLLGGGDTSRLLRVMSSSTILFSLARSGESSHGHVPSPSSKVLRIRKAMFGTVQFYTSRVGVVTRSTRLTVSRHLRTLRSQDPSSGPAR